jgi:hypothetical protein
MTQAEMQDRIVAKAGEDGEFRARLVADPRAAIYELTGEPVPETVTVQVHEESATSFHLVLPPHGRLSESEMADLFAGVLGNNTTTNPSSPDLGPGQPNSTIT